MDGGNLRPRQFFSVTLCLRGENSLTGVALPPGLKNGTGPPHIRLQTDPSIVIFHLQLRSQLRMLSLHAASAIIFFKIETSS